MNARGFATVINCMDGRTQLPVNEWMRNRYKVQFVDTITEPGPVRVLAEPNDPWLAESIRRRAVISVEKHGSQHLAIVAHADCAGNPLSQEKQLEQLRRACRIVQSWNLGVSIDLLWLGDDWHVVLVDTV